MLVGLSNTCIAQRRKQLRLSTGLCPKPQPAATASSLQMQCERGKGGDLGREEAVQVDAQLLRNQRWSLSLGGGWEDKRALAAQPGDLGSGLGLSLPSCAILDKSLNPPEPQGNHG